MVSYINNAVHIDDSMSDIVDIGFVKQGMVPIKHASNMLAEFHAKSKMCTNRRGGMQKQREGLIWIRSGNTPLK